MNHLHPQRALRAHLRHLAPALSLLPATVVVAILMTACGYEEEMLTCPVSVTLVYPQGSIGPYAGARVELIDGRASVFVDSTDAEGTARFRVPPGIYEARSTSQFRTPEWRFFFNGVKSMNVISPDSTNHISVKLFMSKKKNYH